VYDGDYQWIGLRWELDAPRYATITSATIQFRADEPNSGLTALKIGAEGSDNAGPFGTTGHNIDDRWDGTSNTVTAAQVDWDTSTAWVQGNDYTTPDLSAIVQEIVDRDTGAGWVSGNGIVFIVKDDSGGTNQNHRTAEHFLNSPPILTVTWDNGGATGKLQFEVSKSTDGNDVSTCLSSSEYDDGAWHHVVAVNNVFEDKCELYITSISGADEEYVFDDPDHGSNSVDVDGKWYVGASDAGTSHFKGWIDDVMHWDNQNLPSSQANDLSHTNYGTGAHQLNVNLDLTDSNANLISNLYNGPITAIPFQDSKELGLLDTAFTLYNVSMTLPQTVVAPLQRLNFSMAFNPSTTNWEALELDLKIDDTGFNDPYPTYMQIPMPNNPFPSYIVYDPDDEMELYVNNVGDDGIYFTYSGTRLSFFNEQLGSFASPICG